MLGSLFQHRRHTIGKVILVAIVFVFTHAINSYAIMYDYNYQGNMFTSVANSGIGNQAEYTTSNFVTIDILTTALFSQPVNTGWSSHFTGDGTTITSITISDGIQSFTETVGVFPGDTPYGNINISGIDSNFLPTLWNIYSNSEGAGISSIFDANGTIGDFAANPYGYGKSFDPGKWTVSIAPVPEPSTIVLLVMGLLTVTIVKRYNKNNRV